MGGAQRVFSNINFLLSDEYEVISCAFSRETGQNEFDSFKTYFLEVDAGVNLFSKLINFNRRIIKLRRLKRKFKADLCISHMEGANFINILSGVCSRIVVLHGSKLHDEESNSHFTTITTILIKLLYNKADRIVTVSGGIKDELVSHYGIRETKCQVINNFFDFPKIKELAKEKIESKYQTIFNSNDPILIHMGRFHIQKNHFALIKIFQLFKEKNNKAKLVLLGGGELTSDVIFLCKSMNLSVFVQDESTLKVSDVDIYFFGSIKNPYKYLKKSSVFIFPSFWEGFPMALCEAIICGTKVVTSDCPTGPKEIMLINNVKKKQVNYSSFGYLMNIPKEDSDFIDWSVTIETLLSHRNKNENNSFQEFRQLEKKISIDYVKKEWVSLIASMIKGNND